MTKTFDDVDYEAADSFETGTFDDFEKVNQEFRKMEVKDTFSSSGSGEDELSKKKISVADGAHVFGGRILDTREMDYSESLDALKKGSRQETIVQRYLRIREELQQLENELNQSTPSSSLDKMKPSVAKLRDQLNHLKIQKAIVGATKPTTEITQSTFNFIKSPSLKEIKANADAKEITYELNLNAVDSFRNINTNTNTKSLSQIESRIATLEKFIGTETSDQFEKSFSVTESLAKLEKISEAINPNYLESAYRRLKIAAIELGPSTSSSSTSSNNSKPNQMTQETEKMIRKLYDTFGKLESVIDIVPILIERLKSIKSLQREGTALVNSVANFAEDQAAMQEILARQEKTLQTLEQNMISNSEIIQKNIQLLEQGANFKG